MDDCDNDPFASRKSSAFKRLNSQKAGESSAEPPGKWDTIGSLGQRIFNRVQISACCNRRADCDEPRLAGLHGAVDDIQASAYTLQSLSEASSEVRDANVGASAVSVKEVDVAVRFAEELAKRIVKDDQVSTKGQADKIGAATVGRILRS